jgi:two-component system, NtrC family, sensor kinase
LCGKIVAEGVPLLVEDIGNVDYLDRQNNPDRYTSPSFLIMPLVTKTTTIGAVCLSEKSTGKSFSEHDKRFLTVMLGQIGYAVENARLLKQARSAAEQLQQAIQFKDLQLKDAQRQIIQAEKLSALGQLIAGVAHEINNPLTSVRGFSELLMMARDENLNHPDVQKKIKTIHDEASRATKIVQNLLSFAREKPPETRLVNLNDIVRSIVELRQYDLKTRGIDLSTQLDPLLPGALLDPDQIKQVILNLVNNSSQALAKRDIQQIQICTRQVENWIELCVEDTGGGIPGDSIDRIFDPFFTTKQGKTNSGLGLSISYGIIRQHGGTIQAESVENVGTKMVVHLPVTTETQMIHAQKVEEQKVNSDFDHLKALIIDDEKPVVNLLEDFLKLSGVRVVPCYGGLEAIPLLDQEEFDFIICDIRMPDLDGRQLFEQVTIANPTIARRFIFTTGDTADPQTRKFAEAHNLQLVAKPFTHQELMKAVSLITEQQMKKS